MPVLVGVVGCGVAQAQGDRCDRRLQGDTGAQRHAPWRAQVQNC